MQVLKFAWLRMKATLLASSKALVCFVHLLLESESEGEPNFKWKL